MNELCANNHSTISLSDVKLKFDIFPYRLAPVSLLLNSSDVNIRLWTYLLLHSNLRGRRKVWVSVKRTCQELKISKKTYYKARQFLVEIGEIAVETKRGKTPVITFPRMHCLFQSGTEPERKEVSQLGNLRSIPAREPSTEQKERINRNVYIHNPGKFNETIFENEVNKRAREIWDEIYEFESQNQEQIDNIDKIIFYDDILSKKIEVAGDKIKKTNQFQQLKNHCRKTLKHLYEELGNETLDYLISAGDKEFKEAITIK